MSHADGTLSAGNVVSGAGARRIPGTIGAGAVAGAIVGAVVVLPIYLDLVLIAAVIRPGLVALDYDYVGAAGPVLATAYAIVGALIAGVLVVMRGVPTVRAVVATAVAGAASAVTLYWFLPFAPGWLDAAIVVVSAATTAGIVVWVERHPGAARSALHGAAPALVTGTAAGAVTGCFCGLASVFDIGLGADGASRLVEFDPAIGPFMFAPDAAIIGGAAIGALIGGTIAAVTQLLLMSRITRASHRWSLTIAAVVPFVGAALAGFTRARVEDIDGPYFVTRATAAYSTIGAVDSSPLWPQSILVGLEWGSVAAAVGVIVIARTLAVPRPMRHTRSVVRWGAVGAVVAAALFAVIDACSTVLGVLWYPDPGHPGLGDVLLPTPIGIGIVAAGALVVGLVLAQCIRILLAASPSMGAPGRLAAVVLPVFAIAVLPFLHLAFFRNDRAFDVGPSTLLATPVIVVEVVIVLIIAHSARAASAPPSY